MSSGCRPISPFKWELRRATVRGATVTFSIYWPPFLPSRFSACIYPDWFVSCVYEWWLRLTPVYRVTFGSRILGVTIDTPFTFRPHADSKITRTSSSIDILDAICWHRLGSAKENYPHHLQIYYPESTIDSEGFKGGTRGSPIMPRDAVSRTANVERTGRHKWVKFSMTYIHVYIVCVNLYNI